MEESRLNTYHRIKGRAHYQESRLLCDKTHRLIPELNEFATAGRGETYTPKQKVNSFNVEFGYELISALPYAYYLHERGLLTETISGVDTDCLYYFSPKHTINSSIRSWNNMHLAKSIPNIRIHKPVLDKRFSPPPLKERYKNERFVYDKPIVCICNRINKEWNKDAINFFDAECLKKLFTLLSKDYHVVYFNIRGKKQYYDGPVPIDINDYELAREMGIETIHELHENNPDLSFNELQLMVMANSERFITMNGGYAILAAYMGGTNIIYSKQCNELKPEVNSFYSWYNRLGKSRTIHISTYDDLYKKVEVNFVDKVPVVNVLIRSCNRPKFFNSAYRSIIGQTYSNINIVVGYHDANTQKYLTPYKIYPVEYAQYVEEIKATDKKDYGRPFPSNHYMNTLFKEAKDGWIICLDDDDAFTKTTAIEKIMSKVSSENDLLLWRIDMGGRKIPSDENFGNEPVARDISGIAFSVHAKHIRDYISEPYKLWDYRLISYLYKKLNPVWIDEVFTGCQAGRAGGGYRKDKE